MRHNAKGSPSEACPCLIVIISSGTYEHWLEELGSAFDLSNEIEWNEWPTEDGPSLIELHDSAAWQHSGVLTEIKRRAPAEHYQRDRYYVGESAERAITMRALNVAAQEAAREAQERAEQRAWVCAEENERHGFCRHCEALYESQN